ncbi:MAG: RodZ domain-containing protein [Anaerolineaceae bacterium]
MPEITGSKLKQIREERHISLEQVANATHIRLSILRDLEDEEYAELGSRTQAKGFLKLYADYLDVSLDEPEPQENPIVLPEPQVEPTVVLPAPDQPVERSGKKPKAVKPTLVNQKASHQLGEFFKKKPESADSSRSQQILDEIGRELTARRKYLNIPWDLLVEQTHIPQEQLQALEQGNLEAFSSPIHAKGLLQSYARFLNLDAEMMLIRFADSLQERRLENVKPSKKRRKAVKISNPVMVSLKRYFTLDMLFGTILVVGILVFLVWGVVRMVDQPTEQAQTTDLPEVMEVLIGSQTPLGFEPTGTLESTAKSFQLPTSTPFYFPISSDAAIQVVIHARQTVWLRITADGEEVFQGRLPAGSANAYTAEEYLEVEAGNAAALDIVYNEDQMEPGGGMGEIARLRFDQAGMTALPYIPLSQETPTSTPQP